MKQPLSVRAGAFLQRLGSGLSQKSYFDDTQLKRPQGGLFNSLSLDAFRISVDVFYTIWRSSGDVFSCVKELRDNVGSNGYTLENAINADKDADTAEVLQFQKFFGNRFIPLKKKLIRDLQVTGNAYLFLRKNKLGKPLDFQVLDPRTMSVVTKKDGEIVKWIQRAGTEVEEFEPQEIAHWTTESDPNSPVFGLSPLEPILIEVKTDLAALVSNYVLFENEGKPAVHYVLDENVDEANSKNIISYIQENLKGADNRHRSVVLQGVKEIKPISLSPADMEFNVLRRFSTEKVCSAYGVPKSILNYTDSVNYSNGENQKEKFWEGTIAPLEKEMEIFIDEKVMPMLGLTKIKFKCNSRRFDSEDGIRKDLAMGVITINEARKKRGYQYYEPSEMGEFVDKPIIFSGSSAVPVLDVGVDPQLPDGSEQAAKMIEEIAKRYDYGKPTS